MEKKVLRRIAGSLYSPEAQEHIWRPNKEVRELSGVAPILYVVRRRRLQYAGHVARGSGPLATRVAQGAALPLLRPRGRQRKSRRRRPPGAPGGCLETL